MTGNTTKPRSPNPRRRAPGVPVLDIAHDGQRRSIVLNVGPVVFGRGEAADVTVDNEGLSRLHAKFIVASDGAVQLVDLESTNGSFVNGESIAAVRLLEHDEVLLGPDLRASLRYVPDGQDPRGALGVLTDRQLHVACLVAEGLTSAEIAAQLGLSARTVDSHLGRIFRRLEVRGRAELTRLVTEAGLARLACAPR